LRPVLTFWRRRRERDLGETDLLAEIDRLSAANRRRPRASTEKRLLHLRNLAGIRLLEAAGDGAEHAAPDLGALPRSGPLPEVDASQLTAELLRAAVLERGALLVRGLVPRDRAQRLESLIDRSYAERQHHVQGARCDERFYCPFEPVPGYGEDMGRGWVAQGGGVLAADCPAPSFEVFELLRDTGLAALAEGYLGEPALITGQKTTLRIAEPTVPGAWHQDGRFLGRVRALNLWVALTRCGDVAPGLELVPRRFEDYVVAETEEAMFDHMVSDAQARRAAGGLPILRPIFEPGDAMLFDELFLHKTGADPGMEQPRYAIENWFFGASAFPADYAPLSV
jgi:Phytanoyl-CoA dioxygenase (PhyH)